MENQTQEIVKVKPNDTIIKMLHNINVDKKEDFYNAALEYTKTLADSNEAKWRIIRLVKEKPIIMTLMELPSDMKKLITYNNEVNDNIFLNQSIESLTNELLTEWNHKESYKYHNLKVRNKILFHGPTGNGKTTIAKHIARLANLPFVEVNSDVIIDSHVGNSGFNIHQIFNKVKEPCVLFWDEVDTIGRRRGKGGDSAASVENERMVNSILVNIEKLSNDVIFIGATNRKEVLDTAFLRRFDLQFELGNPTEIEKIKFGSQMMDYYKLPVEFMPASLDNYNNFSEIKSMFMDMARKYVLENLINK